MQALSGFSIARLPRIEFGGGTFKKLVPISAAFGRHALLVTGGQSLRVAPQWQKLLADLNEHQMSWVDVQVRAEPSPTLIDTLVSGLRAERIDVVIGIGGGSVLDAAKAIAGLLRVEHSVMDYLEGVGPELPYDGPSVPFIAVPTTAGTGSEATKNAVLSESGESGFKKSFRHESLVPQYAIVDPDLLATCPPALIAANGMDALTQLMEAYVSTKSNALTDGMVIEAIAAARDGLIPWYEQSSDSAAARSKMAFAAMVSGIALAQTGLGSVHGLASPLGAFFPIPHGVVCGTLVAKATEINIRALRQRDPAGAGIAKYATLGRLLTNRTGLDDASACDGLIRQLEAWTVALNLPRLSHYGVGEADFARVIAHCRGSSMKTNPIVVSDQEVKEILQDRL